LILGWESVTGQRSNQLNYVLSLFSYLYRKPAYLLAFLTFNRFACIACFNPIEPNSEVNGHHGHQAKAPAGKYQPRAAVPAPRLNCSRANSDQYRLASLVPDWRGRWRSTAPRCGSHEVEPRVEAVAHNRPIAKSFVGIAGSTISNNHKPCRVVLPCPPAG